MKLAILTLNEIFTMISTTAALKVSIVLDGTRYDRRPTKPQCFDVVASESPLTAERILADRRELTEAGWSMQDAINFAAWKNGEAAPKPVFDNFEAVYEPISRNGAG